jgi:ATP-binding cassette subfamily B protein
MSFSFYDRVQSGQLISRANSDIRSVQMYLTFAPSILVQCSVAILAFAEMLSINVPLALVTMSTMPFVYIVGVRMRKQMFPVSWLIQSRLADVATVVDENINGVRVVKSFAAEDQQLKHLTGAAPPTSGPSGRRCSRTCPVWARRSCCSTAGTWPSTGRRASATSLRSTPTC